MGRSHVTSHGRLHSAHIPNSSGVFVTKNVRLSLQINALRGQWDLEKYRVDLLHIMSEYVGGNSPSEVNLSAKELKETEARVAPVLDGLDQVCWWWWRCCCGYCCCR